MLQVRQIELHFVVGEALSCLAVGHHSTAAPNGVIISERSEETSPGDELRVDVVLESVFKHCKMADEGAREVSCPLAMKRISH